MKKRRKAQLLRKRQEKLFEHQRLEKLMRETLDRTGVTRLRAMGIKAAHAPLPDLKVEFRGVPCSDNLSSVATAKKELPADALRFPIGNNHKQGLELITPGMLKDIQYLGGKKPN